MSGERLLVFPPYSLDTANECLLRDYKKIPLRPKSLAVLRYLIEHPHRLVTKQELLDSVWKSTRVIDAALKVSIREIRQALGDHVDAPKFIESVGRQGYRFIGAIATQLVPGPQSSAATLVHVVGRQEELEQLRGYLDVARCGRRQVVFITGESGIGKTTLVEAFVASLASDSQVVTTYGQCIEQFGAGEAYLPVLDALERLCRVSNGNNALSLLRRFAPSWLLNLPTLIALEERSELERQSLGVTPERRLREIAAFLEALAEDQTVVLVLGNLHWADPSTLVLISFLARRAERARLLVIGTYRDADIERSNHPLKILKAELQLHNYCAHLPLQILSQSAVGDYLTARFHAGTVPTALQTTIYRRSEGNPLFMVNVTDYLVRRAAIVRENGSVKFLATGEPESVPENIRDLIERQVDSLPQEAQELLETASVAGMIFPVAVIAWALDKSREHTERQYHDLAASAHFLQYAGLRRRPNGNGTPRYTFVHALYQKVIYDRIADGKRRRLHQKIGERVEATYAGATELVAAELAYHFECSGDHRRAARYFLQAAKSARSKSGIRRRSTMQKQD